MTIKIHTKYGTAKLNEGYYQISSNKEGNQGKKLHRLIFEEYHKCTLDKNDIIHHIDGDKLNNHPANLICMSRKAHLKLHHTGKNHKGKNNPMYGKHFSEETRKKMSEAQKGEKHHMYGKHFPKEHRKNLSKSRNTTGFYLVSKERCKSCKQKFKWVYCYYENRKRKRISNIDLKKLEEKVKAKGLEWVVVNEDKARAVCEDYGFNYNEVC